MEETARDIVQDQETNNYPVTASEIIGLSKDHRCDDNIFYLIFIARDYKQTWCFRSKTERDIAYMQYLGLTLAI